MLRLKRGQSTLEYVIVFTAIIAAIILFANTLMKQRVGDSLDHVSNQMQMQVQKIDIGN